jgi:hypothetical protein
MAWFLVTAQGQLYLYRHLERKGKQQMGETGKRGRKERSWTVQQFWGMETENVLSQVNEEVGKAQLV